MRFQERRKDLLATRVLTLEQFIEEEDQLAKGDKPAFNVILVLLRPGETTEQYEGEFKDWLCRRDVNLDALYPKPEVERRFQLDFADSRAWELRRQSLAWHQKQRNRPAGLPAGSTTSYCQTRSRKELLAMKEMTLDAFLTTMDHFGPNGPMVDGKRLRPIAVILRPYETRHRCEINFQRWLCKKHITLDCLEEDPEEERRYRQAFAYAHTREYARRKRLSISPPPQRSRYRSQSRSSERKGPRQTRKRSASSERRRRRSGSTSKESGLQDSSPVQKRTRHVEDEPSPFEDSKDLSDDDEQKTGELSRDDVEHVQNSEMDGNEDETSSISASSYAPDTPQLDASSEPANSLFVTTMAEDNMALCQKNTTSTMLTSQKYAETSTQVKAVDVPAKVSDALPAKAEKLTNDAGNSNDIQSVATKQQCLHSGILEATRILARAKDVVSDPTKKLLVDEYTRVTDRVVLNETAIKDFQGYVQEQSEPDAIACDLEIEEMSRSIEREKKRRDSGLSALLAHEWRGQHQQLMKCVLESQGIERAHASHQKLSAAYSKLVQNASVVEALQMKLKGLMRAVDLCQEERTDALSNLSNQLDGALTRRLQLKTECATRCVDMLLSNDSIWTIVNTLMTEDTQTSL